LRSKLESSLARALGERLDASVVQVAAPVEHDRLDPGALRSGGELLADLLRLTGLVALEVFECRPAGARQRAARGVVDELREDAAVRAEYREARTLGRAADLAADAAVAAQAHVAGGANAGRTHARFPTFRRTYSPS